MNVILASTRARLIAASFAALAAVACSRSPLDGPPDSKLTYHEVGALATEVAKTHGVALNEYNQPVLDYDKSRSHAEWHVRFTMRTQQRPGGHFAVIIDDSTRGARLVMGE
jgi:hypothetical protein